MTNFRFQIGERLKSRKEIEHLFSGGSQSVGQYPLRLIWRPAMERRSAFPIQVAMTVSKRNFKRAVDRNRIKRLMREAYRLNKGNLYEALPLQAQQLAWMIIYVGRELPEARKLDKAMQKLMQKFLRQFPARLPTDSSF
jgi:ribonuclease P protein component